MSDRRRRRFGMLSVLSALVVTLCVVASAGAVSAPAPIGRTGANSPARQAAFAAAAQEFGVPENVLLAVSYHLSRWENHAGAPSFSGGYGPMHLTHLDVARSQHGKGDDAAGAARDTRNVASLHTLDAAAGLLGLSPTTLRSDSRQNIRGGAALLAQYARAATGTLPASPADWYTAVMRYSEASNPQVAARFADAVYATMEAGTARTTNDGEAIALVPSAVVPNKPSTLAPSTPAAEPELECPAELIQTQQCEFIPGAYAQNNPDDPSDYGNYDLANRGVDAPDVRYIVIHDTEVSYDLTLQIFQDPTRYVSTHYVIRSSDGHIAQMVETKNVAWHAGNWYVNGHSIGLEHEGFAIEGAAWYTENMYRTSAALVRYLAAKYDIPLDRAHIIGHDDIPGPVSALQAGMHWDPGPFWDWTHYMDLLQAPNGTSKHSVTLRVSPSSNPQTVKDCEGNDELRTQGANFVYLRTAPSPTAPYITNPYIGSEVDPLCANNWGNKAASGQTFYRFSTAVPDWDGIYFGGQQAWFYNPGHNTYTTDGQGTLVTPKGDSAIEVYGRAYPEPSAYPDDIAPQAVVPLDFYTIPAGQTYVAFGPFKSDYFYAPVYTPTLEGAVNRDIQGETEYYQIFYNHRFVFVQADDVTVVQPYEEDEKGNEPPVNTGGFHVYLPLIRR